MDQEGSGGKDADSTEGIQKEEVESSKENLAEEVQSIAGAEQQQKAEAPKAKSSWGFGLFSSKPKETEADIQEKKVLGEL